METIDKAKKYGKKFDDLLASLSELSKGSKIKYSLQTNHNWKDLGLVINATHEDDDSVKAEIFLEGRRYSSWSSNVHTYNVWIDTSERREKHHRTWTFDKTKDLPKKVHAKVVELTDGILAQKRRFRTESDARQKAQDYLVKTYGVGTFTDYTKNNFDSSISYANGDSLHYRLSDGSTITAYLQDFDKKTYTVRNLPYEITENQFKRIIEILEEKK